MDDGSSYTIDIDRLVLDGFELSPRQAERVRALVAVEVRRLLMQEGAPAHPEARQVQHVAASPVAWHPGQGETALAAGIAWQVAQTVQGTAKMGG